MKIRQIIVLLFIFLSAIPMTLLGITNVTFYNRQLESVLENDLKNSVTVQIKAINVFFLERKTDANILRSYQLIHQLLDQDPEAAPDDISELRKFADDILSLRTDSSPFIESATVLDTDFVVVAGSENGSVGQVSTLKDIDPKYLTADFQFSPVVQTAREGSRNRVIAGTQCIYHNGQLEGYLVTEINLNFFEELRTSAKLYNNGTIYLIDGNNTLIAAGDTISARSSFVLSNEERADYLRAWAERPQDETESFLYYKARGDRYVSYYAEIPSTDWKIISSVNIDEVLQTKKAAAQLIFFIFGVLAVLLIAVNYFISRYLGNPIRHMISNFSHIEEAQNFSVRMDREGCWEIRIIEDSINTLLIGMERFMLKEQQTRKTLKYQAERDPFTGLYNREVFHHRLEEELARAQAEGTRIACLFIDVDDFKEFNTKYGHEGGDIVLRFIADTLQAQIGETCGRIGGDEFAACISDAANALEVETTVQKVISILYRGVHIKSHEKSVSVYCSIGVAFSTAGTASAKDLINRADEVMYQVKNEHKNGYRIVYN